MNSAPPVCPCDGRASSGASARPVSPAPVRARATRSTTRESPVVSTVLGPCLCMCRRRRTRRRRSRGQRGGVRVGGTWAGRVRGRGTWALTYKPPDVSALDVRTCGQDAQTVDTTLYENSHLLKPRGPRTSAGYRVIAQQQQQQQQQQQKQQSLHRPARERLPTPTPASISEHKSTGSTAAQPLRQTIQLLDARDRLRVPGILHARRRRGQHSACASKEPKK